VLRAGRINYTNDLPIYCAFDEGAIEFPGTLVADVPAGLNAALLGGTLDISPVSAYFYAAHADELALMPHLCIGSRDEVWSVILASPRPPEALDGARIAVTTESASGRNLLRILLERRYGVVAEFVDDANPLAAALRSEPALLIGDRALDAQFALGPAYVYDLGKLWHEWTGQDMVYAVWAARRDVLRDRRDEVADAMRALDEARAWGLAHPTDVVAAAQNARPRAIGFYNRYYETLNFSFDDRARAGFARFVEESIAIGTLTTPCPTEPERFHVGR
jgi:chorismate dehydratase